MVYHEDIRPRDWPKKTYELWLVENDFDCLHFRMTDAFGSEEAEKINMRETVW